MSDQAADHAQKPLTWREMPSGIPYIVGNEAAERFSFYGMKAILFVYMTKYLVNAMGQPDPLSSEQARAAVHWFVASAYFFPLAGAILSDWLLGKYRTIFWLSLVYCLGHLALAAIPGRAGLLAGLTLIAIGSGGIKPCVSAHVGDQFTEKNRDLLPRVYSWFYFSINLGAFVSSMLTPVLLEEFGPHWGPHIAFGLPGLLMLLATFVFWLGRKKFVHVKPAGFSFIRETFSLDGLKALSGLIPLYLFVAIFWCLYDQTASAWVEQADSMDRRWLGINWLSSQIQAINPIMVLVLIPTCTYLVYPAINALFSLTALRKVAIGFLLAVISFGISATIESEITGGRLIRNADIEPAKDDTSKLKSHELIAQLRELRAWSVGSVSWQLDEPGASDGDSSSGGVGVPVTLRVEVGSTPKGPWTEKATADFAANASAPYLVKLLEPACAKYVRLVVTTSSADSDAPTIDWRKPQLLRVLADESAPPYDAHPHAAQVWPDLTAVGYRPNIVWQLAAYFFLTLAEIFVSITCLEFSYTQAPNKMKSLVMSLYMLSVALGNTLTAVVNEYIPNADGTSKLPGASYYWFFTGLMLAASVGFLVVVATYREKAYLQSAADRE
ncbi:POT family MFS transporter [Schlesneria paludicola]|uniref:POT family MFS transporter n=1 Tax=Schlesneria paludicola TaxID=360056 RepID=UPI00029AE115|nr:POT family MFS transporter [Schlesneria paludicola]